MADKSGIGQIRARLREELLAQWIERVGPIPHSLSKAIGQWVDDYEYKTIREYFEISFDQAELVPEEKFHYVRDHLLRLPKR